MEREKIIIKKRMGKSWKEQPDVVASEACFSVVINTEKAFCLRCTPKALEELVLGRLLTENRIRDAGEVVLMQEEGEIIEVTLKKEKRNNLQEQEPAFYETETLLSLAEIFFSKQGTLFETTGCAHCCGLAYGKEFVSICEDIGRHNALDKAIGAAMKKKIPLAGTAVFSTGRISGDYLEKAFAAGIRTIVSRAAVTGAAVKLAEELGVTLLGFVRGAQANLYFERAPADKKELFTGCCAKSEYE